MDNNKISENCSKCIHKKNNSILNKISKMDAEDWGGFLMLSSSISAGIIAVYYGYINLGFFPTSITACIILFVIGLFMKLMFF